MEITPIIGFLTLNLATGLSSFLMAAWINNFKIKAWSKFGLSLFVIFCSQIIIVEILLGIFGLISYKNISIVIYAIFLISIFLFGKKTLKNFKLENKKPDRPDCLVL